MLDNRLIEYSEKETTASTTYVDMCSDDLYETLKILGCCQTLMAYASYDRSLIKGDADVYVQGWTTPFADLSKGRCGKNSPSSMTSGILYNFKWDKQYNFTLNQLQDIELITQFVHEAFPDHIPAISFRESFFQVG